MCSWRGDDPAALMLGNVLMSDPFSTARRRRINGVFFGRENEVMFNPFLFPASFVELGCRKLNGMYRS